MRRKIIPYNPKLKSLAKALRKNMTLSEVLLWQEIKGKQLLGYDFDRQRPIDNFIVDFYCKELQLAIEIDGDSHDYEYVRTNDERRQQILESLGVNFLRFDDIDIKTNISVVIEEIQDWIEQNGPTPKPLRGGELI
jgi:very-short-patch-repair endonuclease